MTTHPDKTTELPLHHRVAGALVGGKLVFLIAQFSFFIPFLFLFTPFGVVLGATRYGQRFARPALALTGGLLAAQLVSITGSVIGFSLLVVAPPMLGAMGVVTVILWKGLAAGPAAKLLPVSAE